MEPEATSTAAAATPQRRKKTRAPYKCSKCGEPKKGHLCKYNAELVERREALEKMSEHFNKELESMPKLVPPEEPPAPWPKAPKRRQWNDFEQRMRERLDVGHDLSVDERSLKKQLKEITFLELKLEDLRLTKFNLEKERYENLERHQRELRFTLNMNAARIHRVNAVIATD